MNICRIVATGSECTGKSTLLSDLSDHYNVPVISEFLREYTEQLDRQLTYADALPIAKGQIAREEAAEQRILCSIATSAQQGTNRNKNASNIAICHSGHARHVGLAPPTAPCGLADESISHSPYPESKQNPLLLYDTNILSSVVYNRHYYGKNPEWILHQMRTRPYDHYLLCDIDIPWQPDGQRDRPEHRPELQAMFTAALNEFGCSYTVVSGSRKHRLQTALEVIASHI